MAGPSPLSAAEIIAATGDHYYVVPAQGARYPGETNLQNSVLSFAWAVESEYLGDWGGSPTPLAADVDPELRMQLESRIQELYDVAGSPPRWADFTPAERVNISAQTGLFLRWFMSGPDYTQDTVLLEDPATVEWGGCANPDDLEAASNGTPCEAVFQSDCFTIAMPSNRGIQAQNYGRLFGCPDFFFKLEAAVARVSETLADIDAELGLNVDGEVGLAEVGEAVLDEVTTTKDALEEIGPVETPPTIKLGVALVLALVVFKVLK